jgi:DHA2 family multidrug resistance protein
MTATGVDSMYWLSLSLVTLGPLPREEMGAGTGFYNLTRLLGGSFGIALLAVIFDQRRSLHCSNLVEHLTVTKPLLQERLSQLQSLVLERGEGPGRVADQALQLLSDQVGRQASLLAFSDVFRVVGFVVSAGVAAGAVDGWEGAECGRGGGVNL